MNSIAAALGAFMRMTAPLLAAAAASVRAGAQDEPAPEVLEVCAIDRGLGGALRFADGAMQRFHIEASAVRSRLLDRREPGGPAARELAVGSDAELRVLRALEAWCRATYSAEERQELLAPERLPAPVTEEQDTPYRRAELLRAVHRYREVTRPEVTKVFAGRGTVALSLQLRLGDSASQQLLWRRLGEEPFARLHLDTDVEPVPVDSRAESRLLLGLANWLAARLGGREQLWQPEREQLDEPVRLVLRAYRGYLTATSPRLRSAGNFMDRAGGRGGSLRFELSDAQERVLAVRFDHAAGTATPGRLFEGKQLVELGSAREAELLALLRRAAELRRGWQGERRDRQLVMLEVELAQYEAAFRAPKKPG